MEGMDLALPFPITAEIDLLNFGCSLSVDLCNIGHCAELLDRAKYTGLVILMGTGGVVLYLARHKQKTTETEIDGTESWISKFNVLKWIFENDNETDECFNPNIFNFLKSYNLGLLLPQSNEKMISGNISSEACFGDLSLNSLTADQNHRKFLKHPLYGKEEWENAMTKIYRKGVKGSRCKKDEQESKHTSDRKMSCNLRIKTPEDKLILHRAVASNKLSFKFYKPGSDLRMDGDGSENPEDFIEIASQDNLSHQNRPGLHFYKKTLKGKSPAVVCSDINCKSPHCHETEIETEGMEELSLACGMSKEMLDIMQNAGELRRLIRETSLDSLASDLSFGISIRFDNNIKLNTCEALCDFKDELMLPFESCDTEANEEILEKETIDDKYLWKLTDFNAEAESDSESSDDNQDATYWKSHFKGISGIKPSVKLTSEAGDDVSSYVGSNLDPWEWDDDCYYGDETLTSGLDQDMFEQNTQHQSWLPDTCRELDLESELGGGLCYASKNVSVRSSRESTRESRLPPSGNSSPDRE